jgi:uncharacterized membrane protein
MSTAKAMPDRTRSILFIVGGVVAGFLYPLAGVVVCAILAFVAKDRKLRIIMAVLAVAWLLFATMFTSLLGSGSGVTSGS